MPKVKVGDINIYYEVHGKGEPFVMIAGITCSMAFWFKAIPVFSRQYRLVVFDNRGAGRSDAPDIPYTMEMMANDLAGLLDAIGIDSAHILGHSLGGAVAQQFALCYPRRLRSLILASTGFGGPPSIRSNNTEVTRYFERMPSLPLEEVVMEGLHLMLSQEFIDKEPGFIQEYIAKSIEHPAPAHAMMRQGQALMGFNTYERLPEIKAPTLVITGDADMFGPAENSNIMASRIPGAELVILKNMGHGFMFEAEDESNRIMLDFLRRHRSLVKKG
jgi:pimeloyl-ACP methyl ester carboxylesterase